MSIRQYVLGDGPLFFWKRGAGDENIEKNMFAGPEKTK